MMIYFITVIAVMRYSSVFKTLFIVVCVHIPLVAVAVELQFGKSEKWQRFVGLDNVQIIDAHTDNSYIQLAPTSNSGTPSAELFLDFEQPYSAQSFALYTVASQANILSGQPKVGQFSGLFTTKTTPLQWFPHSGSAFSSQTDNSSFTIQLWVNPNDRSGTIMSWESLLVTDRPITPAIDFAHNQRSFVWNIRNLFNATEDGQPIAVNAHELRGNKGDNRDDWTHHHLQYNAQRHYIAYRIDGTLVDVVYTTDDNTATGSPLYKAIPQNLESVLRVGTSYSGLIDNFQITNGLPLPQLTLFAGGVGTIQTDVIDLVDVVGYLDDIEIVSDTPSNTEIVTEYRMSPRRASLLGNSIAWNRLQPNAAPPPGIVGRYLQLRISLYPDGAAELTPALHDVRVTIDPIQLPLAPQLLTVSAGNQSVKLSWKPQSLALGEVHYRVLYGKEEDILNRSLEVGNETMVSISGLQNGQVYYFIVEPFLPNLSRIPGVRTEIVSARPFDPAPQP